MAGSGSVSSSASSGRKDFGRGGGGVGGPRGGGRTRRRHRRQRGPVRVELPESEKVGQVRAAAVQLSGDGVPQLRSGPHHYDDAGAAEPDQDRLRPRGRSMAGVLGRVGTAATGGTIAQLLGHAMLTAMGLG